MESAKEIKNLELVIIHGKIMNLEVLPIIQDDIREAQKDDEYLIKALKFDKVAKKEEFTVASNGTIRFKGRIYVSEMTELREQLLKEIHETPYFIRSGTIKMYQDIIKGYW